MKSVLYMSVVSPYLPHSATDDIAMKASVFNEARGITGILIRKGRYFIQYIEGEESKIDELMTIIGRDDRHSDIVVLDEGVVEERLFKDWHLQTNEIIIGILMKKLQDDSRDHINRGFYFLSALFED